jgi:hypothetical protein
MVRKAVWIATVSSCTGLCAYCGGILCGPSSGSVWAYVTNEKSLYDDIQYSKAIEQEAVKKEIVGNPKGNATYADVNQAYFNGKAPVQHPDKTLTLTREDFALFTQELSVLNPVLSSIKRARDCTPARSAYFAPSTFLLPAYRFAL